VCAGIGLGIVRRLGAEGAKVMVSSRRQMNVDEAVAQLKSEGLEVAGCVCHVGNPEHIKRLVEVRPGTLNPGIHRQLRKCCIKLLIVLVEHSCAGPILFQPDLQAPVKFR